MPVDKFFEIRKEQSAVKSGMIADYFWAWAKIMGAQVRETANPKIAYVDLFAGRGTYEDGSKSTPLMILEKAIENEDMHDILITVFNDSNDEHCAALSSAIERLPGIEKLKNKPIVKKLVVGKEVADTFGKITIVPTFFLFDPYGYKGISIDLINSFLKNFGCDGVIFFNYNRINPGLGNPLVEDDIDALFGKSAADSLRERVKHLNVNQREEAIINEIKSSLQKLGAICVLPFCFKKSDTDRTSHYIIFVTKNKTGCKIMREIMGKYDTGTSTTDFQYVPPQRRQKGLTDFCDLGDDLTEKLLEDFAGQTLTMDELFHKHMLKTKLGEKEYRDALIKLETENIITTEPSADKRLHRKETITFAKDVKVTFPPRSK